MVRLHGLVSHLFYDLVLLSEQRKPEEESPVKDTDAKQLKQEATVNGSGDSSANSKEIQEGKSQVASDGLYFPPPFYPQ